MLRIVESVGVYVSPDEVASIVEATELENISVDEMHAGPVRGISAFKDFSVDVLTPKPEYAIADDGSLLLVKITNAVRCSDESAESDDDVTNVTVSHIARFRVIGDIEVTGSALSAFIETNVFFFVYPYFRQLVNSITADLGIPPVVLGYRRRNDLPYSEDSLNED